MLVRTEVHSLVVRRSSPASQSPTERLTLSQPKKHLYRNIIALRVPWPLRCIHPKPDLRVHVAVVSIVAVVLTSSSLSTHCSRELLRHCAHTVEQYVSL